MSALHSSLFRRVDRVYFLFYLQREEVLMPYIRALSTFRDGVRKVAIAKGETALKDIESASAGDGKAGNRVTVGEHDV